jgi:hypothetical protein
MPSCAKPRANPKQLSGGGSDQQAPRRRHVCVASIISDCSASNTSRTSRRQRRPPYLMRCCTGNQFCSLSDALQPLCLGLLGGRSQQYNRYTTEKWKQPKRREGVPDALLDGFKSNSERQSNWTFEQNISFFPFGLEAHLGCLPLSPGRLQGSASRKPVPFSL